MHMSLSDREIETGSDREFELSGPRGSGSDQKLEGRITEGPSRAPGVPVQRLRARAKIEVNSKNVGV